MVSHRLFASLAAMVLVTCAAGMIWKAGRVSGTLTDADGKAVASATVRLTQPATTSGPIGPSGGGPNLFMPSQGDKEIARTTTDSSGNFRFQNVPDGSYTIVATVNKKSAKDGVTVVSGKTATVNLKLPK